MDGTKDLLVIKFKFMLKKEKRDELIADIVNQMKNRVVFIPSCCDVEYIPGDIKVVIKDEEFPE